MKNLAVIFDMDGVLVDSEHAMREAAIKSLSRFGIKPKHDDFLEFTGMGEDMFIGGVARKYGKEYTPDMKDYAYDIYVKDAENSVIVYKDVLRVLKNLKENGFKLAVASAADFVKVNANLRCIGVDTSFFDAVVSGSDISKKKPDPEIFLTAAKRIGAEPKECMVVEDALSGIKAARAAAMSCMAITSSFDKEALKTAMPDYIVENISEACEKIIEWSKAI